jgi:hypothetical protein
LGIAERLLGSRRHSELEAMETHAHGSRRQLTMFVPAALGADLEPLRQLLDPIQRRLIAAHVTLCREDELARVPAAELRARRGGQALTPITLQFGPPEVFSGHGVMLNCIAGERAFHALRGCLLGSSDIRHQQPHITLAHPRNPRSPDNCASNYTRLPQVLTITFASLCLIEQHAGQSWSVLQTFELLG